ncbi:MAG: OmpA family protein [Proteobacteria bacterium]|nr:OmpA family protein [Pseudomonadota bacterium]
MSKKISLRTISMVGLASVGGLITTTPALADVSVKLEPGVAIPLSAPQSTIFDTGGGQSIKALFGVSRYLDIGPAVSFLFLPSEAPLAASGTVWGFGGGLRLKRPHDQLTSGVSPWLDADLLYLRTGDLDRLGFDAALGLAFPVDDARSFWVGPFVRYQQTFDTARTGYDTRDAKVLLAGLSVEFGSGVAPKPVVIVEKVVERIEAPPVPPQVVTQPVVSCPDRDADTVPDTIDRCPDVVGPIESGGCPVYQKVVVTKEKIELKEKLFFAWDRAEIKPASFALLDDVVKALQDNAALHIQIEGHTDTSGDATHNQQLSERRAASVRDYLTSHRIAGDRLVAKGFGPSVPLETNATSAGRERNRRVEFVVLPITPATPNGSSK